MCTVSQITARRCFGFAMGVGQWWARIFCLFSSFICLLLCIATCKYIFDHKCNVKYLLLMFCEKRIKRRSLMNLLPRTWHLTPDTWHMAQAEYLSSTLKKIEIEYFFGSSFFSFELSCIRAFFGNLFACRISSIWKSNSVCVWSECFSAMPRCCWRCLTLLFVLTDQI